MMRRSWREGRDEIRQDLEWERGREGGKDFGGERSVTLNILHWGERREYHPNLNPGLYLVSKIHADEK